MNDEETHWTKSDLAEKAVPLKEPCPECKEMKLMQFGPAVWCIGRFCKYGLGKSGKILHKRK